MDSDYSSNYNNNGKPSQEIDAAAAAAPSSSSIFNIDGLVSTSPTSSSSSKRPRLVHLLIYYYYCRNLMRLYKNMMNLLLSRRGTEKRVVQIPMKETDEGPRLKADSWSWRKYGQKPIKGSPYPRGYYRCSSSKGCPARKQVERSRLDPAMLVVTYSSEHNHPCPLSTNHHHHHSAASRTAKKPQSVEKIITEQVEPEEKFADLAAGEDSMMAATAAAEDELGWFGEMASSSLSSSIFSRYDADVAASVLLPMGEEEEEESLFADLGELPECSLVFRRGFLETSQQRRRYVAAPWCGTTSL